MARKYLLVLTIIALIILLVFTSNFSNNKQNAEENEEKDAPSQVESTEEAGLSDYFDKRDEDLDLTPSVTGSSKAKCSVNGNLVEEGTVIDGVTCFAP